MPTAIPELSLPLTAEYLWLTQGEISSARPLMQGDVFNRQSANQRGILMVVSHPCSMRAGLRLRPRQTIVNIEQIKPPSSVDCWRAGYYDYMPLPGLLHDSIGKGYPAANFRLISSAMTENLVPDKRIAILSFEGILILQQRLAHHLTRAIIDLPTLARVSEAVFVEVELQEEWVASATKGLPSSNLEEATKMAEAAFQDLLDQQDRRLRVMLGELPTRPAAMREIRRSIADGKLQRPAFRILDDT